MNNKDVLRAFFEKVDKPIPSKEVIEKTGIYCGTISILEDDGVLTTWYKLRNKPVIDYTERFLPMHADRAESIVGYLQSADRLVRRAELMDVLHIPLNDVKYITASLTPEYISSFLSLPPIPDCNICFHRDRCEKKRTADSGGSGLYHGKKPEENCNLFKDDYRLTAQES